MLLECGWRAYLRFRGLIPRAAQSTRLVGGSAKPSRFGWGMRIGRTWSLRCDFLPQCELASSVRLSFGRAPRPQPGRPLVPRNAPSSLSSVLACHDATLASCSESPANEPNK